MAIIIVDTTVDENDGSIVDGDVSLRDAIAAANSGDTITFTSGAGEAFEAGGTIRLAQALGALVLSSDVTIDGDLDDDGAPDVTITGDTLGDDVLTTDPLGNTITDAFNNSRSADNVRVFNVTGGSSTIDGLVITSGSIIDGGGILVATGATIAVTNSSVSGNNGDRFGGGIHNAGTLALTGTTVSGNTAEGYGGGVLNDGTATLTNTTVSGNDARWGGGIYNREASTLTLTNTTVSGNSAENDGGGISNFEGLTLTNTTMSGNTAGQHGGGISNWGTAILTNTTVSGNSAERDGGGIYSSSFRGTTTLANTIVLGNGAQTGPETVGTITENGPNIIGGQAVSYVFASVGANPNTGVESGLLAANGGAVQTIALNPNAGNPALDAGQDDRLDESVVGLDLTGDGDMADVIDTDARGSGFPRTADLAGVANNGANTIDLGAFEADSLIANTAPTIVSAGTASVPQGQTRAIDVETTDDFNSEGWGLTYANSGGADAALFDLDTETGVLTFVSVPDFEAPGDANGDNDYEVRVTVMNSGGLTDVQDFVVTVTEQPQTFKVTTADDELDDLDGLGTVSLANFGGADDLSLREALTLADEVPFIVDTITFASGAGAAFEAGGTIRLAQALGALVLSSDVTIDGDLDDDGAPNVTITGDTLGDDATTTDPLGNTISEASYRGTNAADNVRVFNVTSGSSTLDGLVITGGSVSGNGGGVSVADGATLTVTNSSASGNRGLDGGGIYNRGTATLTNTTVSGNSAGRYGIGGGIYNTGTATLSNTTVSDNSFGGISNTGTATLTDTTVSGNGGNYGAGGIDNRGIVTLTNTTVSGNRAPYAGGGIDNRGTATLTNTTVSGNSAGFWEGGGINNSGTATLTNATLSSNSAGGDGGGVYNTSAGTLTLANTIVLGNTAQSGPEVIGGYTGSGPNIVGGSAGDVFAAIDGATGGGVLADNGGAVETITLKNDASNPALDAGQDDRLDESVVGLDLNGDGDTTDVIDTDARGSGFDRRIDLAGIPNNGANTVDLGAFEAGAGLTGTAPMIVSAATSSVPENTTFVIDVNAIDNVDVETNGLTYSLSGGADQVAFQIDANSGVLGFISAPDHENPQDDGADNVYEVQVTVTDSDGSSDVQDITVTVTDILERTFEVTTADDELDDADGLGTVSVANFGGADDLSLREALALADQLSVSTDTITFASGAGEAFETGGTIRLSQALGELVLSSELTVDGDIDDDGAPDVTITGDTSGDDALTADSLGNSITDAFTNNNTADNVRVFNVTGDASTLDGLVITGGSVRGNRDDGGGFLVANGATLAMSNSSVSGNTANEQGGGIYNRGTVTLTNTTVSGNSSEFGGGILNWGNATLTNTTVSGNDAVNGGGIWNNNGTLTLTNTTVSGNTANQDGGGIMNAATATLTNTTVSGNTAREEGGGIYAYRTATLTNSIVLGNIAPTRPEIQGTITENGPNIIGGNAGDVFAAIDGATGGGLLADSGGAVQTIALKPVVANPALDAGQDDRLDESVVGLDLNGDGDTADVIDTDVRGSGFIRFVDFPGVANNGDNTVDLGAFEVQDGLPRVSETDVNSFFSLRDQFFAPEGVIIEANLRSDGVDRDFFEVSGLPGGAFVEAEVVDNGLDTVLGRFDAHGNVIEIDDNSGQGSLSRLTSIVPDDGVVNLAVSGFADFDFDGRDDGSGRPHGESGDYQLVVHPTILPTVTETDINSLFRLREQFSAPEGLLIEANLRDDGFDRDYFEISDLAPGSRFQAEVVDTGLDTVLGRFDAHGNVIETDDNSGQGSLSRLTGIVPDDGVLNLAVSGYPDFDFDGRDDRSGYPHGESGDYDLVLIV